jgi:hypothetical protein
LLLLRFQQCFFYCFHPSKASAKVLHFLQPTKFFFCFFLQKVEQRSQLS